MVHAFFQCHMKVTISQGAILIITKFTLYEPCGRDLITGAQSHIGHFFAIFFKLMHAAGLYLSSEFVDKTNVNFEGTIMKEKQDDYFTNTPTEALKWLKSPHVIAIGL